MVGFQVTVLDDRREFANPERFPFAAKTTVVDPAAGWLTDCEIGENAFIVIVTRGHAATSPPAPCVDGPADRL